MILQPYLLRMELEIAGERGSFVCNIFIAFKSLNISEVCKRCLER